MPRATPGGAGALTLGLESLYYGRRTFGWLCVRSTVATLHITRPRPAGALTHARRDVRIGGGRDDPSLPPAMSERLVRLRECGARGTTLESGHESGTS